ncbi:hypothetical protein [Streptomyces himalayensis]|uniref:hypothetical protein n=1 Tax=Streptomyces himalayensis TaxID=2820085 RepID=UPI0035A976DE
MFAALAEFIRELIVQGTNEGLDAARARGARLGRPPAMADEQVRYVTPATCSPARRTPSPRLRSSSASRGTQSTTTCPS